MTPPQPADAPSHPEPPAPDEPAPRPRTRWGDRGQRRVDILDAARRRIGGGGYLSLNMRDLAAAAGVSPATLYSYFATKEELFATLYAEAIRDHIVDIRPGCHLDQGLVPLLEHVLSRYIDLYRAYGRYFTLWSALRADLEPEQAPFPRELIVELRTATLEYSRLVVRATRRAAARDGLQLVGGEMGPAFLWSTLNGVADHLTSERRTLDPFDSDRLVAFAAERLARALTEPA
jgi:AcrR family transcriptional regulator